MITTTATAALAGILRLSRVLPLPGTPCANMAAAPRRDRIRHHRTLHYRCWSSATPSTHSL
jgi:hypothetical protein